MHAAHKNECRGGARQIVETFSKYTADFTARAARFATADSCYLLLCVVVLAQAALMFVWGVLQ
jgi:hypothetical protein